MASSDTWWHRVPQYGCKETQPSAPWGILQHVVLILICDALVSITSHWLSSIVSIFTATGELLLSLSSDL